MLRGFGLQTAAIAVGGRNPIPTALSNSESYNGTSWTATPALNTARWALGTSGIQTAGLIFGGNASGVLSAATESWNGSSWTSVSSMNTARLGLTGFGTQTLAAGVGGDNAAATFYVNTELWNGTSWTSNPNGLSTARTYGMACGTQAAGLVLGGFNSPTFNGLTNTEEFTGPGAAVTKTVTVS
jgi:hypothetical protein